MVIPQWKLGDSNAVKCPQYYRNRHRLYGDEINEYAVLLGFPIEMVNRLKKQKENIELTMMYVCAQTRIIWLIDGCGFHFFLQIMKKNNINGYNLHNQQSIERCGCASKWNEVEQYFILLPYQILF